MADETASDIDAWQRAFRATLDDAIEHVRTVIFDERWEETRAEAGSDEAALRESVHLHERELARLFAFVRASGALAGAVGWSELKAELRREALETGVEITLRTALESGFYAAEPVPLGDHGRYLAWAELLTRFLTSRVDRSGAPRDGATDEERLEWAYQALAPLEEHDAFHAAFVGWLREREPGDEEAIIAQAARLLALPRYDLALNTSLRWLAESSQR
jgi:hypothetical protein